MKHMILFLFGLCAACSNVSYVALGGAREEIMIGTHRFAVMHDGEHAEAVRMSRLGGITGAQSMALAHEAVRQVTGCKILKHRATTSYGVQNYFQLECSETALRSGSAT